MPRYLSIHLPTWSADRVRRRLRRTAAKQLARALRDERDAEHAKHAAHTGHTTAHATHDRRARSGGSPDARALCVLLTARGVGAQVAPTVAAACGASLAAGVRPGASLAQARGLLFGRPLHVEPLDAAGDRAALDALARAATRSSPLVAADPPDGLVLEIGGSERLFGSERALVEGTLAWLAAFGFTARAGVASTIGCAWALARFGTRVAAERSRRVAPPSLAVGIDVPAIERQRGERDERDGRDGRDDARRASHDATHTAPPPRPHIPTAAPGEEFDALEHLPVAALRCAPEVVEALDEMGVERIGQLAALPRWELPARFVSERGARGRGGPLERLDQALGRRPETLERPRDLARPRVERSFAGPVRDRTTLGLALRAALDELLDRLAERGAGAAEFVVELWPSDAPSDAPPKRLVRHTSRASRDARHLWALLEHDLERAPIGFGVERLALEARALREARGTQERVDGDGDPRAREALGAFVDALVARLGPRAVVGARCEEERRPEAAFRARPPLEEHDPLAAGAARELALHLPRRARPTRLFAAPPPVTAVECDGERPVAFVVRGRRHRLVRALGLERIVLPWWPGAAPSEVDRAVRAPLEGRDPLDVRAARDAWRVLGEDGRWSWLVRSRVFVWRTADARAADEKDDEEHRNDERDPDARRCGHDAIGSALDIDDEEVLAERWFVHGDWA